MKTVEKPWGREVWIACDNGRYAGKFLDIKKGRRLSLQYHRNKHETLYLLEGKALFTLENDEGRLVETEMLPGEVRVVAPGRRHRMESVVDCRFIEFSSPELEDVVRVEDDYDRT
ncbi:MAG: cupin domain-containing protein [bacterium]